MPRKKAEQPEQPAISDFDLYQRATEATAIYPSQVGIVYTGLGLASEAGEVVGQLKKAFRDDGGGTLTNERRAAILGEIGDVLWYCARLSAELGASFAEVAQANINKLNARKEAGTISGSGDDR